jgi:hypothetical protein
VLQKIKDVNIRNIYIIEQYSYLPSDILSDAASVDVFFTYDFKLKKSLEDSGFIAFYLDHILDSAFLHSNHFLFYDFFENWFKDCDGNDIFVHKNIPFGFSFRLDVWNDLVLYAKKFLCIKQLTDLPCDKMVVISADSDLINMLNQFNIKYEHQKPSSEGQFFYFPITKWLAERLEPTGIRKFLYKVRASLNIVFSNFSIVFDKLFFGEKLTNVFFQEYHPTKNILTELRKNKHLKLHLVNFSRGTPIKAKLAERVVPIKSASVSNDYVKGFIDKFRCKRINRLKTTCGSDLSEQAYIKIEQKLLNSFSEKINVLDSCVSYIEKYNFKLQILVSNIGLVTTLFDCVCKAKGIPSFLIINGLLGPEYLDESKFATYINSYSQSIKDTYFRGLNNIAVLGDPRMDAYSNPSITRKLDNTHPKIVIGASGYNNLDFNSYVAVEFDFLYDVLSSIDNHSYEYKDSSICIKVRPNGYIQQYRDFVSLYFPMLSVEFQDTKPMFEVLKEADLYISIYSQSLFEASCLKVPVVYYKKDTEILTTPFDGKSELVTASTKEELVELLKLFRQKSDVFEPFMNKNVLEKYIGPLDGNNTQRNVDFIYKILETKEV